MCAAKVQNFPTGTKLKIGDKLDHLTIIDIKYPYGKSQLITAECDCKDCNRNRITITKSNLQNKIYLYCNFEDCKYNEANWIIINNQEYSLMPGSIIGNLEILGRIYTGYKSKYNLEVRCIGDCNSLSFQINKDSLQHKSYYDCGDLNCSSFNNRFENESSYNNWKGIKDRLFNPNQKDFDHYDEIILFEPKMEPEWIDDPKAFDTYTKTLSPTKKEMRQLYPGEIISIDRIKNHLGYIKGNLRWATMEMQIHNRRNAFEYNIIKAIRWDYEVNNIPQHELIIKYGIQSGIISPIVRYQRYSNISISEEKAEYLQSKTINGLIEAQIIAQGGLIANTQYLQRLTY